MRTPRNHRRSKADSYIEIRLMAIAAVTVGLVTLLIPAVVHAIDANGDNLDDAWEAHYGITTDAYASTNLVGWWQLDGPTNVVDRSANQINGSLSGFATNAFGPGLFSNALYFTATSQVNFPADAALNATNGLTFSTWIKSVSGATNEATVATWSDVQTNSWSVGIATNGMAAITFSEGLENIQTVGPSTNSATLYDGQWHHLAATWAPGQEARVYVDGENQGSGMITGWNPGPVATFVFGAPDSSVTNQTFILDEARLYNRALGPNEITQLPVTYTDLNGNGLSVWEDYQRGLSPTGEYVGSALHSTHSLPVSTDEPGSSDFTPWMSDPDLHQFMLQFDSTPPGHHPNYWDKGHWINAVEGRWHNNQIEYRITYGPVPNKLKGLWWYWYLGISEPYFNALAKEKAAAGFTLLDANSFSEPNGTRHYQGVWHKVITASSSNSTPSGK